MNRIPFLREKEQRKYTSPTKFQTKKARQSPATLDFLNDFKVFF